MTADDPPLGVSTAIIDIYQLVRYTWNMSAANQTELARIIRAAIERDGRSLYRIAQEADVSYQALHPFARGQREDIVLSTADRLCRVLGLTLRPVQSKRRKTKGG